MKTALHFSGGKDSLACLYLYRALWPELIVAWVNTGAAYPETVAYMERWKARLPHFLEIKSDQPGNIVARGWPSDVVPVRQTAIGEMVGAAADGLRVQSYFECCAANIWIPMWNAMREMGVTRIIRGQRNADRRKAPIRSGHTEDGIEYVFPIEGWSDDEVFDYLDREGADMPEAYGLGEKTSRDCWDCTAYLEENARRIANLPEDRRDVVLGRLREIGLATAREPLMRWGLFA